MKLRHFTCLLLAAICTAAFCLTAAAADAGIQAKKVEQKNGQITLSYKLTSTELKDPADSSKISTATKNTIRTMAKKNIFSFTLPLDSTADRQSVEQDLGLAFVYSPRMEAMSHVASAPDSVTYQYRNVLKLTQTHYIQSFLENSIAVTLTADTHWDGTEYRDSSFFFSTTGQSVSNALYTAKDGRVYRIYSILDADGRCTAQYMVFQYGNTDYSLSVCGLQTKSGSHTELPKNFTHELLDTMVYPA